MAQPVQLLVMLGLVKEMGPYGWIMWSVQQMMLLFKIVGMIQPITVGIQRMPVPYVKVLRDTLADKVFHKLLL